MSTFLFILLLILGLLLWSAYRVLSPVWRLFQRAKGGREEFGSGENLSRNTDESVPGDEEQTTVDLIHETNMDLDGGEYVDYEEVREERK